jgi:hypothetical protein
MTDFHTLDELIEARKLLAETSGRISSYADNCFDAPIAKLLRNRVREIDAFLARPLYGKGE